MDTDDRAFVVWGIGLVVNLFVIYLYFGSNISLFGILLLLFFGWIPCTVPVAIISAIIGFCSFSDVFSGGSSSYSSSNSSSRKYGTRNKLYLSPGEKIMFHVETYEVFHGEGGGIIGHTLLESFVINVA